MKKCCEDLNSLVAHVERLILKICVQLRPISIFKPFGGWRKAYPPYSADIFLYDQIHCFV